MKPFDEPASEGEDPLATADPLATFDPDMTIDGTLDPTDEGTIDSGQATPESFQLPTLADEVRSKVDEICEQFESAWQSGTGQPSLEDFVPPDLEVGLKQVLVRQLIMLDIDYRKQKNVSLPPTEYLSKIPDCRQAIQSVLTPRRSSVPRGYGSVSAGRTTPDHRGPSAAVLPHDPTSRYRPTQLHARGGLGAVFRAQDEELNRVVALKEILPDQASNEKYQNRFVFEAEVTGSLEHPGIVPVYGLGRYQDQRPYYAMRFIRGESFRSQIAEFHQQHAKSAAETYFGREFRALLRRFNEACNAIHYAHVHGVLHRDIKPDNIMLGKYGETLVVDWGLAKLIDRREENEQAGLATTQVEIAGSGSRTSLGMAIGTPMYMSPEQAMGLHDQLDGRTDIYSLGAMLFNLVTGQHPIEGKSSREIVSNVRDGKVRQVNTVMPHAPKALASICRKAMATKASDRYGTAVDLADDLDRWMNDEVALAHIGHEGVLEKAGRLIRRYRSWTVAGAVAMLVITAVAIISALLINQARKNEAIAKADAVHRFRDSREAIDTWLTQTSDWLTFYPEAQSVRQRFLQLAAKDYAKLSQQSSRDATLELERGRIKIKLGDLLRNQNQYEQALAQYQQAQSIFSAHVGGSDLGIRFQAEHAQADTKRGFALAGLERFDEAQDAFAAASERLKELAGKSDDELIRNDLADAYISSGELYLLLDDVKQAEDQLTAAIDQLRPAPDALPNLQLDLKVAKAHRLRGDVYAAIGEPLQAIAEIDKAIAAVSPAVAVDGDQPEYLQTLAAAQISKAASCREQGLIEPMFDCLREAVEAYQALRISDPADPRYLEKHALALTNLGNAYFESDQSTGAKSVLLQGHVLFEDLVAKHPQIPRLRRGLATSEDLLGQVWIDLNDPPTEAQQYLAQAIGQFDRLAEFGRIGMPDEAVRDADSKLELQLGYVEEKAIAQSHYAQSLRDQKELATATQFFEGSIQILRQLIERSPLPKYENALAHVHENYGLLLYPQDPERASGQFQAARDSWLSLADRLTPNYHADLAWLLMSCPDASIRDPKSALTHAGDAVAASPRNPRFLSLQALAAALTDDAQRAVKLIAEIETIRGSLIDRDYFVLAIARSELGQDEQASKSLADGVDWMQEHRPFSTDADRLRNMAETELATEAS